MDNFVEVVKNALEYYDSNNLKYYDLINSFKYYTINKNERAIIFYDSDKKKLKEYEYEYIGKYLIDKNIWRWGWAAAELDKNAIITSRKVLNYALDLEHKTGLSLKMELISSLSRVTSPVQVDIHVAITSFLSKKPLIYELDDYGEVLPMKMHHRCIKHVRRIKQF